MCRRPRRIIIIIIIGEEGLKKGVVVVVRVTKSRLPFDDHPVVHDVVHDDFNERVGFGTTGGIGNMHHL